MNLSWGEIEIEALKKMYLNSDNITVDNLEEYKDDKKYRTYLYAMPQACNEAIRKILTVKPIIKSYTLKYDEASNKYDLKKMIPKFKNIYEIVCDGNRNLNYSIEANNILVIDDWCSGNGNITIYYEAYHDLIKNSTSSSFTLDLDRELVTLIPIYIAGALYKDDDIQQATIWMNEFETALSEIKASNKEMISNPNKITTVYGVDW